MPGEPTVAVCPACGERVPVPADWRVVECPACHGIVTRMADDASYD